MSEQDFVGSISTDEIWRGTDTTRCLTDDLDAMDNIHNSLSGTYAALSHTHSGYASSNHTHSEYAASNHAHSGYAASNHTHDDYLSTDGGELNGNLNVNGILRVNGQQSFYYQDSTASQTVGTNNAAGGTTICCGSSANVVLNGANTKVPNVLPKTNNAYYCGNSSYRWKGIYSSSAVDVSSDERLKENVESLDESAAVKLIEGIGVKSFNYIGDDKSQVGVIAQDILKESPELAQALVTQGEDGYYGVKTSDLVFPLIVTVQNLMREVEELRNLR